MISTDLKITTLRSAVAEGYIKMAAGTLERVASDDLPKKGPLGVARTAGIMAGKKTHELIPFCHPLSLDQVEVEITPGEDRIVVKGFATTVAKTGVEMEALTAASVALLTLYDMLKPVDKDMEIGGVRLVEKKGGKTDFERDKKLVKKAAVIVTSDSTAAGKREDKSGKIIKAYLEEIGVPEIQYQVLPDDADQIAALVKKLADEGISLILTTGGTGLGPRDVTVEAVEGVLDRQLPGVMEAARNFGQRRTPYAMLSRGVAGQLGKSLVVTLPGSSGGTREGMAALFPALLHGFKMIGGGGH